MFSRRRAAATAATEERQALAISPSPWAGRRRTSNSIRAERRSFARSSSPLSWGAASRAAWAARSRLQIRQKVPSRLLVQLSGSCTFSPPIRPTETPQLSQVQRLASLLLVAVALTRPPPPKRICRGRQANSKLSYSFFLQRGDPRPRSASARKGEDTPRAARSP